MTVEAPDRCVLDDCRGFDAETREWVYQVCCLEPDHAASVCPEEHELGRVPFDEPTGVIA